MLGAAGRSSSSSAELEKLQRQIEQAKKFFPSVPELRSLSGTIKEIKGNVLLLETPASFNPFEELPSIREVMVGSTVKIIKNEPKDADLIQKEQEKYQQQLIELQKKIKPGVPPEPGSYPIPPTFFVESTISLKDLKPGDQVLVDAEENIKTKARFEASKITVQGGVSAPPIGVPYAPLP